MDFSKIIAQLKELNPVKELIEAVIAMHGENAERLAQLTEIEEAIQALEQRLPRSVLHRMRENPNYVYTPPAVAVQSPRPKIRATEPLVTLVIGAKGRLVRHVPPEIHDGIRPTEVWLGCNLQQPEEPPTAEAAVRVPNPKPKPTLPPATAEAALPVPEPNLTWAVSGRKRSQAS